MELDGKLLAITGIGGFIGLRTAERALQRGMRVRGLDMSEPAAVRARKAGADVVVGDVTSPSAVRDLCRGADIVLHTAAIVHESGSMDEFRRVNVGGTVNVCENAREAGAKAFVQLSSVMVYGFTFPPYVTETGPLRGENNPYCQTKIESEEAALRYNQPPRFGVIVIRPGDVYGPGSVPWVVRPAKLMRKRQFGLPGGGQGIMNHVYVDNLIDAIFLALEHEMWGETFNVTDGADTTFRSYFTRLAKAVGAPRPYSVPLPLVKGIAWIMQKSAVLLGREPQVSPDAIAFLNRPYPYSIEKARKLLGYEPRVTLDEGMARTALWLQEAGRN